MSLKYAAIRAAFEVMSLSGLARLIRSRSACRGVIFTLHRVVPERPADFAPNAILQVRPSFLAYAIMRVRRLGFDTVSLDEALRRLQSDAPEKPFVVFTFDDAYRDNLTHALPILRHLECPFTLYVPTALVDGVGEVWWQALEDIIAGQDGIAIQPDGETEYFDCRSLKQKRQIYDALYWRMRQMPEPQRVAFIRELARQYGFDLERQCRDLIMDWHELKAFGRERLCTIGAHTVHHYELAKLPADEAVSEIEESLRVLKAQFGATPRHLSFPIGGTLSAGPREFGIARDLGLASAVTTRPGGLYAGDRNRLHSLPRISLNGLFQAGRYVDVFATGAIFSHLPAARSVALTRG
jgi:peptidoglycan/xylan/chitin deacetylase (PgdA/CDA1 family)